MELLDTDSCRGTIPMEPPMSNSSMRPQNPDLDFDDTGHFLQGALCTIAARAWGATTPSRAENLVNQQCHIKSSRWCIAPLGTDSCRGTVPMEPPMSNSSMRHQNPVGDFDDTGQIL